METIRDGKMSVYSVRTGLSSILKNYSPAERDKAKNTAINKVRFEMPKEQGVIRALDAMLGDNYMQYDEFVSFLREGTLTDVDFQRVTMEARHSISRLTPKFSTLVEALLSLDWQNHSDALIRDYVEFYVDLLVAQNRYVNFGISQLIKFWIPNDKDEENWPSGTPSEQTRPALETVHKILQRLLSIIPLSFDIALDAIEKQFPYYKRPGHVLGGYIHNVLRMLEYKPISCNFVMQLLFRKLLMLDANALRFDIQEAEDEDEELEEAGAMFAIELDSDKAELKMKHPIAETLDICLEKMFTFFENVAKSSRLSLNNSSGGGGGGTIDAGVLFKALLNAFDDAILPSHNTHHVQFLLFYFCSFKSVLAEKFLSSLWSKVIDPNVSAPIRQSSVGYIASLLARSKFISRSTLQNYLLEMSTWAHHYIERSDSVRSNCSLKANIVFFAVCQGIFYMIAFRSRDLTHDKKGLLFLQSLQLSAIVSCTFNPLRVCTPAVATAFAGVTRAYQLAYCHTILERNARRKLATVYANNTATPEECLDTFFPFDPYLLKKSAKYITPIYLQYQASDAEEQEIESSSRRKRKESGMEVGDDVDDFLVDKRQRLCDMSRSHEREMQFTYGLSPGFHV